MTGSLRKLEIVDRDRERNRRLETAIGEHLYRARVHTMRELGGRRGGRGVNGQPKRLRVVDTDVHVRQWQQRIRPPDAIGVPARVIWPTWVVELGELLTE